MHIGSRSDADCITCDMLDQLVSSFDPFTVHHPLHLCNDGSECQNFQISVLPADLGAIAQHRGANPASDEEFPSDADAGRTTSIMSALRQEYLLSPAQLV